MLPLRTFLAAGLVLTVAGCARRTVVVAPGPTVSRGETGPSTAVTLGVPPGHLPPPGECRVWVPGVPPGQQRHPARSCSGILATAPAGSFVIYRPTRDRKVVRVRYLDSHRAGVVIAVRVFDAASGKFLRDEKPDANEDDEQGQGKGKKKP